MTADPLDRIAPICELFAASGLAELELRGPAGRLLLRRDGDGGAATVESRPGGEAGSPEEAGADSVAVPSPGVGLFLRAHPLRAEPLVEIGESVARGQALGFLRVGALLRVVAAPQDGTVRAVHRAEGSLAGYGDPLFDLSPPA